MRFSLALVLAVAIASAQDDLHHRYNAAQSFAEKGNQTQATAEYKLFLDEALRRLGNAQAQLLDTNAADELLR